MLYTTKKLKLFFLFSGTIPLLVTIYLIPLFFINMFLFNWIMDFQMLENVVRLVLLFEFVQRNNFELSGTFLLDSLAL